MRIAFLVIAHNNPAHLARLLSALQHDDVDIYIHIDRKSDYLYRVLEKFPRVRATTRRYSIFWGQFSMVRATLELMRTALQSEKKYEYLALASGVDFPLCDMSYLLDYLTAHQGAQFMNCERISAKPDFRHRFEVVNFNVPNTRNILLGKLLRKLMGVCGGYLMRAGYRRDFSKVLGDLEPSQGTQWWALTNDACKYILSFVSENPQFCRFFKNTLIPDESFFHTILGNSHFSNVIVPSLTYVDWSRPEGPCPAVIDGEHVDLFVAHRRHVKGAEKGPSEVLLARKFSDDSASICAQIEAQLW